MLVSPVDEGCPVREIVYPALAREAPWSRLSWVVGKPVIAFVTVVETADGELWVVEPPEQDPRVTPNLVMRMADVLTRKLGCRRRLGGG